MRAYLRLDLVAFEAASVASLMAAIRFLPIGVLRYQTFKGNKIEIHNGQGLHNI